MNIFKKMGKVIAYPVTKPIEILKERGKRQMKEILQGLIRHVLTTVGGGLVASGAIGSSDLEAIIGGVLALFGIIWSVISKKKATV
jgi:hypothetical protein